MKRLFPMLAIAGLALLATSCFQEDLLLPPPVPEIEDIDSGILDVKVSGRHPQLFAKINFISGDPATKSGSSDYYDTGTESIGNLLDPSKQKTAVVGDYSICEIPFKSNVLSNYALLTESSNIGVFGESVSQVKIFLVDWKNRSSGEETAYVVTMIPDDCFSVSLHPDYSFLNDMDWFSGAILFSDLNGNHVDTYITGPDVMGHAILLDNSLADIVPEECISYSLSLQSPGTKSLYWYDWYSNSLGLVVMLDGGGGGYDDDFGWYDQLEASYCIANSSSNSVFVTYQDWDEPEMGNDNLDPKTLERNRLLNNVKGDKGGGGGSQDRDSVPVNDKIRVSGKTLKVSGKRFDVESFKHKTEDAFKLDVIKDLVSIISIEVTIEIKDSLKTNDGKTTYALTYPSGKIEVSKAAESGTIFEELLHVYQNQTEGSGWQDGDKEFEAKVFLAILDNLSTGETSITFDFYNQTDRLNPFLSFYNNPSEETYEAALQALRTDPFAYDDNQYPVTESFSFDDRIKHIIGLIKKNKK